MRKWPCCVKNCLRCVPKRKPSRVRWRRQRPSAARDNRRTTNRSGHCVGGPLRLLLYVAGGPRSFRLALRTRTGACPAGVCTMPVTWAWVVAHCVRAPSLCPTDSARHFAKTAVTIATTTGDEPDCNTCVISTHTRIYNTVIFDCRPLHRINWLGGIMGPAEWVQGEGWWY